VNNCAICDKAEATRGNYCEPCLEREFSSTDPEDIEAAVGFMRINFPTRTLCADCNRDITGQANHECKQQRAANIAARGSRKPKKVCGGTYHYPEWSTTAPARCDRCERDNPEKYEGDPCYEGAR